MTLMIHHSITYHVLWADVLNKPKFEGFQLLKYSAFCIFVARNGTPRHATTADSAESSVDFRGCSSDRNVGKGSFYSHYRVELIIELSKLSGVLVVCC